MKMLLRLGFVAAALALGIWLWMRLFPPAETVIRSHVQELARSASFDGTESPVARFANAEKLAGFFSPDAKVYLDGPDVGRHSLNGRDEIMQTAIATRSYISSLSVNFVDVNVKVNDDKVSAHVELTARAQARGEADFAIQELRLIFKKIKGQWLITHVETMKTLT